MQLGLFDEVDETQAREAAPPVIGANNEWKPPELVAFDAALRRKALRDAIQILQRVKVQVAARILLASGFSIGDMTDRTKLMASVQSSIVTAAREGLTGYELRERIETHVANANHLENNALQEVTDDGRTVSTRNVRRDLGDPDREYGRDSGRNSESMGAGMAGTRRGDGGQQVVSEALEDANGEREDDTLRSSRDDALGEQRDPGHARSENGPAESGPVVTQAADYTLSEEDRIGLGGLGEKFADNVRAIQTVKRLAAEGRHAVADEQRVLARYVGWGGLKGVFDPANKQWAKQHATLRALLTEEEWTAANRSVLDAFYTAPIVVNAIYDGVRRMGFSGGRTLDPSVGVGNFFGFMPEDIRNASTLHGVELDVLTSQIVSALYPNAQIAKATGFESYKVPAGYFDMVIGNPPFGSQSVVDDAGSVYSGWSIHNYFFAKSIEMLRPGGIMPMVVSHAFMDKLDPHVRQWIARRAELVSGVRLPNTTFKENANTEVVTDVLVFRRLDDLTIGKVETPDWLDTTDVPLVNSGTGETELLPVNNYFIKNPQNVLGVQTAAGTMYRANSYTVEPSGDLGEQLAAWVQTLPEGVFVPFDRSNDALEAESAIDVPEGIKEGSFFLRNGGEIGLRLPDLLGKTRAVIWTPPNQKAAERMQGMITIRTFLRRQIALERTAGASDHEIETGRKSLNQVYDDFQKKYGYLNDPVNRRLFMDDTESALVQALEFDYEKAITPAKADELGIAVRPARARKADIFRQRVLFPPMDMAHVDTAKDALLHSLNQFGRVNIEYMQEAYGKDVDTILAELDDLIYRDPVRGLVTADEYLSGDVKTKLAEAKKAETSTPAFAKNVRALEAVIPADKLPSEIFASIGGIWIPPEVYSEFASVISGTAVEFRHMKASGQWLIGERKGGDFAKNNNEYGTEKLGALDILYQTMNGRGLEVKKRIVVEGKERYVTDEDATEAVRQKADKIRTLWDSWLWSDGPRTDRLTQIYNERFNRTVERKYDGSHLSFPGMSPAITLLAHQKNGVWRGVQDRDMLADQVVGAGKTYELATIAMEMRRLGIARKPLFAVPNHLTLQWRSEFYRLYPGANVLAATPQDFEKENRGKLFSKIVTGNWDAVIIGHSSLKKIAVPIEAEARIFQEQLDDIADAVEDLKRERGDRNIIRDMEKIKSNLEAKLKLLQEKAGKKDDVVNFEDMGVDALFVDELHEFKNLFFYTQMQRVAGLGNPAGSGKAMDLFVKVRWLKDTFGENAPLITATGTPVSNSLAEMFTVQRYMQYAELRDQGLHNFDAWAKQFGDVQTVYEVAPSGTGYRLSQRFAKFKNLPALMGAYRSFSDVITLDDLKAQEAARGKVFPVPKVLGGRPQNIVAKRSPLQEAFFGVPEICRDESGNPLFEIDLAKPVSITQHENEKWLLTTDTATRTFATKEEAALALAIGATTPKMTIDPKSIIGQFENLRELTRRTKGKINALSLTSLANKAGLDYRLIDATAPDYPDSKINLAVREMWGLYNQWGADKGTQLVFCDMSIPLSAKAKLATKEKRVYVRDDDGNLIHKRGTLHSVKEYEGLPYFLVAEGKGRDRTYCMYDAVTGQVLRAGFDTKANAHEWAHRFITQDDGQERWLDLREQGRAIESDEIAELKNERGLDEDGDSADAEISLEDIDGASGVAGFSVYDDIKAKLIALGVPEHEIQFIHDHDTPQAKEALFKRVNAGEVRFVLGSTSKMGAGTNVQRVLIGEHHIDAPWRPSDLEQREGRIIRRGNVLYERDPDNFMVFIGRYATEMTYDTRRWQLLEHKATGVAQLRNYSGENEIEDVTSEAANSADMKAAASGNPLILKETQLATEVKKLRALARAHLDGEYSLRSRMNHNRNWVEMYGPEEKAEIDQWIAKRDGADALLVYDRKKYHDKESAVAVMTKLGGDLQHMDTQRTVTYRGISFMYDRLDARAPVLTYPDHERWGLQPYSPTGVITRMDNFVENLERKRANVEEKIRLAQETVNETAKLIGKPFEREAELARAIEDHAKVQRALMKLNSLAAVKPEEREQFDASVQRQKTTLIGMGYEDAVAELNDEDIGDVLAEGTTRVVKASEQQPGIEGDTAEDMEAYIRVAADNVGELRRGDVYRVLVESNAPEKREAIASYIKARRSDLADEVDTVLAEEPILSSKPQTSVVRARNASEEVRKGVGEQLQDAWNARVSDTFIVGKEYPATVIYKGQERRFAIWKDSGHGPLKCKTVYEAQMGTEFRFGEIRNGFFKDMGAKNLWALTPEAKQIHLDEFNAVFSTLERNQSKAMVGQSVQPVHATPSEGITVATHGQHWGKIKEVKGGYAIQDVGRGALIAHALSTLSSVPCVNDVVQIKYANGQANIFNTSRSAEIER